MKKYVFMALWMGLAQLLPAQNPYKHEERVPYREWNNEMVVSVKIGKKSFPFILRVNENTAILTDRVDELGITHQVLPALSIGSIVAAERVHVAIEDNPSWRSENIAGVIGRDVLEKYVVSFNRRAKTIVFSTPLKPDYVNLGNRIILHNHMLVELPYAKDAFLPVEVDLTGSDFLYVSPADYHKLKPQLHNGRLNQIKFVKTVLKEQPVTEDHFADVSRLGGAVLDEGIVCIDFPKNRLYFQPYETLQTNTTVVEEVAKSQSPSQATVMPIDCVQFNKKIFHYRAGHKWTYLGDKPAIIDFWADWCLPCKQMMPVVEKLAAKYADRIYFYKMNIDEAPETARCYDITSIPVLMFVPGNGKKAVTVMGAKTEKEIEALIRKYFKLR